MVGRRHATSIFVPKKNLACSLEYCEEKPRAVSNQPGHAQQLVRHIVPFYDTTPSFFVDGAMNGGGAWFCGKWNPCISKTSS